MRKRDVFLCVLGIACFMGFLSNIFWKDSFKACSHYPTTSTATVASPQSEELTNLLKMIEWPLSPTNVSLEFSTHPKTSLYFIINPRATYVIGESLEVLIVAKDHKGRTKNYGGDYFHVKLHSLSLKAGVSGSVTDHYNGSYTARFIFQWPGETRISVKLMHSSELIAILHQQRDTRPDKVSFKGYFEKNGTQEVVECNFDLPGQDVCEYYDQQNQEKWVCQRPKKLPCDSYRDHSSGVNRKIQSQEQKPFFSMSLIDQEIPSNLGSLNVLPLKNVTNGSNVSCIAGLKNPNPSGFYYQDVWKSLVCSNTQFDHHTMAAKCLAGKMVYMFGDSTLRQWWEYLVDFIPSTYHCGSEANFLNMRENSVLSLKQNPFSRRSNEEKKKIKELGPDRPILDIKQQSSDRGRSYTRSFSTSCYEKRSWLAGCDVSHAFYCFPCLLFQSPGTETLWTKTGFRDLKHLTEKCKRHESSRSHHDNAMTLQMFGRCSIAEQLDEGYRIGIRRHNEEVRRNRHILSRIIDCVKFCGAFELALRGHDESESSANPGVFRALVDFVSCLDGALKEHLENATVFKGTSKTVQNELLDCMLSVLKEHIIQEAQNSDFLSIQADETTDIATQCQLVLVLRYIDDRNKIQERFFEFISLQSTTADSIATALQEHLAVILPEDQKGKLICQAYDGASVMRGATSGVQKKIQDVYPNAHYIHCYAHQLNLIMQQATSRISKVRIFFSNLGGFASFFSRSPKRTDVLDKVVAHRLPTSSSVRWNFHSRAVNTVFEHREDLIRCFETIQDSGDFDPVTTREAGCFAELLENQDFNFFLTLFHDIMPHVDLLYAKLQRKDIDSVHIKGSIQQFQQSIQKIRDSLHSLVGQISEGGSQPKRRCLRDPEAQKRIATEVCDTILLHTMERFSFTNHLVSATLFQGDRFEEYAREFPKDALSTTVKTYPVLDGNKLRTELSTIYSKEEFRTCRGAVDLFKLLLENNLEEIFRETITLLKLIITIPMTTEEAERCFSTLKRIKTFLRNSMTQERLNALAMLSMEKELVTEMTDFNQKVIEKFATQKERRAKFLFK